MSVQAMTWVFDHSESTGADRLVLLAIANHAGDDGTAYPGIATLAREAHVSVKTVKRCLGSLEDAGEISRLVNGAPDERIPRDKRPNLYTLLGLTRGGDNDGSPPGDRGGHPRPRGGDIHDRAGGTSGGPKPSVEPSVESSNGKPASADSPYDGSGDPPTVEAIRQKRAVYPPQFVECWSLYPKRVAGRDHDKLGAYRVWRARVVEAPKAGMTRVRRMENLLAAVQGYAIECDDDDRDERFMKDASTFFGAHSVMAHCARLARERCELPRLSVVS